MIYVVMYVNMLGIGKFVSWGHGKERACVSVCACRSGAATQSKIRVGERAAFTEWHVVDPIFAKVRWLGIILLTWPTLTHGMIWTIEMLFGEASSEFKRECYLHWNTQLRSTSKSSKILWVFDETKQEDNKEDQQQTWCASSRRKAFFGDQLEHQRGALESVCGQLRAHLKRRQRSNWGTRRQGVSQKWVFSQEV